MLKDNDLTIKNYDLLLSEEILDEISALTNASIDEISRLLELINDQEREIFFDYWDDYLECAHEYGQSAVNAFVFEFSINCLCLSNFEDSFMGEYASIEDYIKEKVSKGELTQDLMIDCESTFEDLGLSFACGFVFSSDF